MEVPGARESRSLSELAVLAHTRRLAMTITQVVQLRAAHITAGSDLNVVNGRRVDREGTLNADTE